MATTQLREPAPRRQTEPASLDPALWRHMLQQVRTVHPTLNRTWFDQLTPRLMPNGVIHIQVISQAQLHFCQNQCQQAFTTAAQQITGRLTSVVFHFDAGTGGIFNDTDQLVALNPDYAFENFVIGPCNRLAHAASSAVAEQPGKAYNPLFIHGDVGLGKTHLLQAVCQKILDRQPDARILYLTCDSFINQFINAVGSGDMNQFRYRYRHVDMLVIDDIHFLGGDKARTQEEFFHTFNTLYQGHKQIVLSADCPPSEIPELEERLVSRFNWGLVARIDKPCYETRMAILQKKAAMRGVNMPDDVLCYVASKIDSNTRELEGAVTKIQGLASLHDGKVDLELAKAAFGETATPEQRRVTFQQIFDVVTKYYNVRLSDLQSKKRHKSIAFPRQVCMFLARKYTRYSLEEIGGHFGGRDHTTVLHAVRTVDGDMKADAEIANQLTQIENHLAV
jgi:chromosomal replication initiator protein